MYMDLTDMISGGTEEQQIPEQKLTKEEYAAKKQQEREEVWAEVDSTGTGSFFRMEKKLKGFLDFYGKSVYTENSESAFDLRTASGF
mgnify:CR=1 FL=1